MAMLLNIPEWRFDKNSHRTLCLKRHCKRLEFDTGSWAEITVYWYETKIEVSVIGSLLPYMKDHAPSTWGRLHGWTQDRIIYVPGPTSNEHFPGDCWKTMHEYGWQVHRTQHEAERWLQKRAAIGVI